MDSLLDLSGKVALVTGASRGIGAEIARRLAGQGARVFVNYVADAAGRNREEAGAVARGLAGAEAVEADVADERGVAAMLDRVRAAAGGLDILVNNAGILLDRSLRKMTAEEWEAVMAVDLRGPFQCLRAAMPLLRDGGRVVNIASLSAQMGFFGQANYASAKAGLIALTKVAARELARQRITVNAVAPGVVDTEMMSGVRAEAREELIRQVPLGRMARAEDIANVVLFLCSPMAGYLTGQTVHVNGGAFMP